MSRDQPTPSNGSPGSARIMHFVRAGTPSGAYGHGQEVASMPMERILPISLSSTWCVWPWMLVTLLYGWRISCTSRQSRTQKFHGGKYS